MSTSGACNIISGSHIFLFAVGFSVGVFGFRRCIQKGTGFLSLLFKEIQVYSGSNLRVARRGLSEDPSGLSAIKVLP